MNKILIVLASALFSTLAFAASAATATVPFDTGAGPLEILLPVFCPDGTRAAFMGYVVIGHESYTKWGCPSGEIIYVLM